MKEKEFEVGKHVFYVGVGLCEIRERTTVDGRDYFVLTTLDKKNDTTIYVPIDCSDQLDRVYPIASKEMLLDAIKNAKDLNIDWNDNRRERQERFLSILRSNDFANILIMIKCLFARSLLLKNDNKRLSTCDNDILLKAKFIIEQLISYTFSISFLEAQQMLFDYYES